MMKLSRSAKSGLGILLGIWAMGAENSPAADVETKGNPIILESILCNGKGKVSVVKDKESEGKMGDLLQTGDHVKTDALCSARLLYPDNSSLWVGRSSEVEVHSSGPDLQGAVISKGRVRAVVAKPGMTSQTPRYRFIFKAKSMVMGVRGTDFVVEQDGEAGASALHTLEGRVEVARENKVLLKEGGAIPVQKGEYLQTSAGQEIGQPKKFDTSQYSADLRQKEPDFTQFEISPPTQYRSSKLLVAPGSAKDSPQKTDNGILDRVRKDLNDAAKTHQKSLDDNIGK
jgi:hypothetical protein